MTVMKMTVELPASLSQEQEQATRCAIEQATENIEEWARLLASGEANTTDFAWLSDARSGDSTGSDYCQPEASAHGGAEENPFVAGLLQDAPSGDALKALKVATMKRSYALRRALMANTLTVAQVAELLSLTRQAINARIAKKELCAVMYKGSYHLPLWQFDADADAGVLEGANAVWEMLSGLSTLAKMNWMVLSNPYLDGQTPADCLHQGGVARVVDAAHLIGER